MSFEIFLIVSGLILVATSIWQPNSAEDRKDPKDSLYSYSFLKYVRALLIGITFLSLGLAILLQNILSVGTGWFLLLPGSAGVLFSITGLMILFRRKFNKQIWKVFKTGSSPERDRRGLGAAFLLIGLVTVFTWVLLLWPN